MIRKALLEDLPILLEIYENARAYMAKSGNPNQWGKSNPPKETLVDDIHKNRLYVYEKNNEILGSFMFTTEADPTYSVIEGAWLSDTKYGVIHRVASSGKEKGVMDKIVAYCWNEIAHLRIDTHEDNATMQKAIFRNGFKECGIIYLLNGEPRIAYEKV